MLRSLDATASAAAATAAAVDAVRSTVYSDAAITRERPRGLMSEDS
jgi:hypothetical protein